MPGCFLHGLLVELLFGEWHWPQGTDPQGEWDVHLRELDRGLTRGWLRGCASNQYVCPERKENLSRTLAGTSHRVPSPSAEIQPLAPSYIKKTPLTQHQDTSASGVGHRGGCSYGVGLVPRCRHLWSRGCWGIIHAGEPLPSSKMQLLLGKA